jgi:serine/threonine protein kinase
MTTHLTRGIRVGDRYRLERELGQGTDGTTWEAVDERLDRPVALRLFTPGSDRKTIVKRAGLAASLTHPRVVRVFDTGEDAGRFFTVSELVIESLQTVKLPLAPDTALQTAVDIAEALQYAHERGVVHGNLHEGNVLLSEGGAKVGDFALSPHSASAGPPDDLRQFGALMRRVSRTPDHAVPTGFVRVLERLTSGTYGSAAEALGELRALRPAPAGRSRPAPRRGWLVIFLALLLGVVAFGAMQLGGGPPGKEQKLIDYDAIKGKPFAPATIRDFDPFTKDVPKAENPEQAPRAIDGNPATAWFTETYSGTPNFNGNKAGVGLILSFNKAEDVGRARILWAKQGCNVELRHSDDVSAPVEEWGTAAEIVKSPVASAFEFPAVGARYWMVWITQLVPEGKGYQCGVKEIQLYSP